MKYIPISWSCNNQNSDWQQSLLEIYSRNQFCEYVFWICYKSVQLWYKWVQLFVVTNWCIVDRNRHSVFCYKSVQLWYKWAQLFVVTNCCVVDRNRDNLFCYKSVQLCYKLVQVLQNVTTLLQIGIGVKNLVQLLQIGI